jgi:putative inorganic carbon (hco3(-)) transporter
VWLVIAGFVGAGLLQATGTAVRVLTGAQQVSEAARVTGWLADPNHFAGFLVLVIPILVAAGIALEPRWLTIPTGLLALALVLALLATLSRSGWLGLLAGMVVLSGLLPGRRVRLLAVTAAIIVVVLLAGLAVPIAARLAPHSTGPWEMLASRMRVWTVAFTLFSQHPLFGIGVGNFAQYYPAYDAYPVGVLHAHNILLNMAVERGLLGLAGFVAVCVALATALVRGWRWATTPLDRAIAAGMIAALCAYLVHSMLDVSYYDYPALLTFWLFAGVAASLPRILRPPVAA